MYIDNNSISNKGCEFIADFLKTNKYLKTLNLEKNNFDDKGVKFIVESLTMCDLESSRSHLITLDLRYNNIGDEGIESIIKLLKINRSLTNVYLYLYFYSDLNFEKFNLMTDLLDINRINKEKIKKERANEKIYLHFYMQNNYWQFLEFFDELSY